MKSKSYYEYATVGEFCWLNGLKDTTKPGLIGTICGATKAHTLSKFFIIKLFQNKTLYKRNDFIDFLKENTNDS